VDRRSRWLPVVLATLALFLLPRAARSAPKDAAATRIADDAINNDYLGLHFNEAVKKLRGAIATCGANACSAQVRARLHRDLGVVLIAGLNRTGEGKKEFVEAMKADPRITLQKDLTTPTIEQTFQAARGGAGGPTAAPAAAAQSGGGGDIIHTPPAEQAVLTPLPIYVELPAGVAATKVLVMYKPFGTADWQKLELKKLGSGYGGEIPCQAVGSATGDLSYYIQANDAEGDIVALNGSRKAPNKVPIQNEIAGEVPHLPGRPAPAKCRDKADCPPGFPGCGKKAGKAWGASCEKDRECGDGLACKAGTCETGEKSDSAEPASSGKSCETSSDCEAGETCNAAKTCEVPRAPRKKMWVSFNVQQDISFVPAQQDVCGSPKNVAPPAFTCFDSEGFVYNDYGIPKASDPDLGTGNEIKGGPRRSNLRLLIDFSYLLGKNFTVGARLGYVLNTQPDRPLAKFHGEARIAYWLGGDPFAQQSLRPYVAAMGGLAEVNDKFSVQVFETQAGYDMNPTLDVWRRGARSFAGAAVGVMIPTSSNMGILAELKVQTFFPTSASTLSPSVGYALGL
jgi:hypothetical protein